ncbi:hypothetical protein AA309_00815 [Microvirga vignae]|uniref:Uncharacterized protein n=1 Tax=Microvirga vignae TaxID=1225564 RepID=A0A0H1RJ07_9HYPH|nr:hypothetical protein AA309_00815 [Microvirga vignae]
MGWKDRVWNDLADALPVHAKDRTAEDIRQNESVWATLPAAPPIPASLRVRLSVVGRIRQREGFFELEREGALKTRIPDGGKPRQEQQSKQRLHEKEENARSGHRSIQLSYGCLRSPV